MLACSRASSVSSACRARSSLPSGRWRPISASTWASSRRCEKFQEELMDALKIIDRGDLTPADMRGAWAGELGQTQFLPSSYDKFAVDFDGNGRRDLIHSV